MEKQIEEMAKDFDTVMQSRCFHKSCNECEFDRYDNCKATMLADALINDYSYRKASDVAREIRQRMNEKMGKHTHLLGKEYVQRIMREIEKEYTESEDSE